MNIISFIRSIQPNSSWENVKSLIHSRLMPLGIRYSYEQPEMGSRVILTTKRFTANFSHPIVSQCNGLVFDYNTCKILSIPPYAFNGNVKISTIQQQNTDVNLSDNYNIYKVNDGTVVTLYYYKNEWRMSSTNGYDVGDLKWFGDKTYWEIFNEISNANNYKFDIKKLNKNRSYSIGFTHPDFHPFKGRSESDIKRMWYIQAAELTNAYITNRDDIGLPSQEYIHGKITIKNLLEQTNNALENYIKTGTQCFGFILRAKNGIFQDSLHMPMSNILMESNLMKEIRQQIYHPMREAKYKDVRFIALNSYLNVHKKMNFIRLFPQFNQEYLMYDNVMNKLTNTIMKYFKKSIPEEEAIKSADEEELKYIKQAFVSIGFIEKNYRIDVDVQLRNIVFDVIQQPGHAEMYYELIYSD